MAVPILVTPVRVIGGPVGSLIGVTGPTGPGSALLAGPTGVEGYAGKLGRTGVTGLHGTDSQVTGPAGRPGPTGEVGYTGPTGPQSKAAIPPSRVRYFENEAGVVNVGAGSGHYVGCGFTYTLERGDKYMWVIFTGLFYCKAGNTQIEIRYGVPPAAPPGGGLFSYGTSWGEVEQTIVLPPNPTAPFMTVPFVISDQLHFSFQNTFWFDLLLTNTAGNNASVRNVSCLLMEL
jgi:hypothetical protein